MLESLFTKVTELQASNFIEKGLQHRCFPVNIAKFLRAPILENICERLILTKAIFFVRIFERDILTLECRNTKLLTAFIKRSVFS